MLLQLYEQSLAISNKKIQLTVGSAVHFKQVIENIENLSSGEKALVAHRLISSLEVRHDDCVDQA
ncbi:MAG: hypothetical protein HFP81_02815 [Methylococcales symbiont of Hymedesmia sp. n. MRB-2018]|nr:MAG: hypothetical protein HFP81_02815 [Methylococcales symbiont of Hymedesmia sp. n. MRB-2018]